MFKRITQSFRKSSLIVISLLASVSWLSSQTISMPNIIGNNMVLQQNTQVPLWGWAAAGTQVTITASWGSSQTVSTPISGKWFVKLQTPVATPGQAPAYTITVSGPQNTLTFSNILVGEVWLASGQSNMWFWMSYYIADMPGVVNSTSEIAAANYPNIRLFNETSAWSDTIVKNVSGAWSACSPTSVPKFSAVAYYFGRKLYNTLNVPIGIISAAYSGSYLQTWIRDSVLQSDATLKAKYVDTYQSSWGYICKPGVMYNAMIAPIIPYAIKGTIWYQGESNVGNQDYYGRGNLALINDWRKSWGINFSFYAVQITPRFIAAGQIDTTQNRGFFREYQRGILSDPKAGIVTTSDVLVNETERLTAHPTNKKPVGERLALLALAKDYSQPVQCSGPQYKSFKVEGNKIRIYFTKESLGSGLTTNDGGYIKHFRITGPQVTQKNQYFYPAWAKIEDSTIVVSSPYVTSPTAVRYAYTDGAMTNLQNVEGLPAASFRTDSWSEYPYPPFLNLPYPIPTTTEFSTAKLMSVRLFPVPTRSTLNISGVEDGIKALYIYDIEGRMIRSFTGNLTETETINIDGLSSGIYTLRIITKKSAADFKIVKE